jgi:hypothetical protein
LIEAVPSIVVGAVQASAAAALAGNTTSTNAAINATLTLPNR